jgi:DNA polymerase-3 subunit delta
VRPDEFIANVGKALPAITLIHGDEPFQASECLDALREHARSNGISERLSFDASTGFDWLELEASADNLSLFAERRLFEVRLSGRPGVDGAKAVERLAGAGGQDLLVLVCPLLDRKATGTAWFKRVAALATVVGVQPVPPGQMPAWLKRRFASRGIAVTDDACALLAERTEGNLLAAAQEVDKLSLLLPEGAPADADTVLQAAGDSARYNAFDLVDAAVDGDAPRVVRVLAGLRGEGVELPPLLGSVAWMLRNLWGVSERVARGEPIENVLRRREYFVLSRRGAGVRAVVQRQGRDGLADCMRRAQRVDRAIKGRSPDDPWAGLERLCLDLAGSRILAGQ